MHCTFTRVGVAVVFVAGIFAVARAAGPELKVTLTDMHLCCAGCTSAVEKAAAKIPGVKCVAKVDDDAVLTADSKESMQKAIDEIGKAGLCGMPDSKEVKFTPAKTPEGNVKKLEIAHIHNCCKKCTDAIKEALAEVKGVKSNTVETKKTSFVVEGDFSASDVVKSLMKSGFSPELKTAM